MKNLLHTQKIPKSRFESGENATEQEEEKKKTRIMSWETDLENGGSLSKLERLLNGVIHIFISRFLQRRYR